MAKVRKPRRSHDDSDSPWKRMLDLYLPFFIVLLDPDLHARIDWAAGVESLEPGLPRHRKGGRTSHRFVDKLVRVRLRTGEKKLLLIHIEVQSGRQKRFTERVFLYAIRIREDAKFGGDYPLSLGILVDGDPNWRPCEFDFSAGVGRWFSEMGFSFPIVKILDFESRRPEFEASANPFALFILAQLDTIETKKKFGDRAGRKLALAKAILRRMPADEARNLLEFIDCLMALPDELETRWYNDLNSYAKEEKMPYVSIFERKGMEKGIEKGSITTLYRCLEWPLEKQFGVEGARFWKELSKVRDLKKLNQIYQTLRTAKSISELRNCLK